MDKAVVAGGDLSRSRLQVLHHLPFQSEHECLTSLSQQKWSVFGPSLQSQSQSPVNLQSRAEPYRAEPVYFALAHVVGHASLEQHIHRSHVVKQMVDWSFQHLRQLILHPMQQ